MNNNSKKQEKILENENNIENKDKTSNNNNEIIINKESQKEENVLEKTNEIQNNLNQQKDQITQRNEVINQFLDQIETKNNKTDINLKIINKEDEESDDPFLKAEKEYRNKHNKNINDKNDKNGQAMKNINQEYSNSLRYKIENEKHSELNSQSKEKELIGKIVYNHFKKGIKTNSLELKNFFKPSIIKYPQRIYLKAVEELELNYLKMKSYDRRTGTFDLKSFNKKTYSYINKNKKNKNCFNTIKTSPNIINNNNNYNNYTLNSTSSGLKTITFNDYLKYTINKRNKLNKLSKKFLYHNHDMLSTHNNDDFSSNKENNIFYTSLSINSQLTEKNNKTNNNINTKNDKNDNQYKTLPNVQSIQEEKKEIKSETKIHENINKTIKNNGSHTEKNKLSTDKMRAYLQEYKKNLIKAKTNLLLNSNKLIKNNNNNNSKNLLSKLLYSIDDPGNPYSLNYSKTLLKNKYNMEIHYNKFELGVPLLNIKKNNKRRLKSSSLFGQNKIKIRDKIAKTSQNNLIPGSSNLYPNNSRKKINNRYNLGTNYTGSNFYKK